MPQLTMTLQGAAAVSKLLALFEGGVRGATRTTVRIEAPLVYAMPIETGRFRSGRIARKAGPAHYMKGAREAVEARAPAVLAAAIPKGEKAAQDAMTGLARLGTEVARRIVPRRSGRLAGSIRSRTGR